MLRLTNIKIENGFAKAVFYPETEKSGGEITVDIKNGEIASIVHVPGYEIMYPYHAAKQLKKMAEKNDTRTECVVMWY